MSDSEIESDEAFNSEDEAQFKRHYDELAPARGAPLSSKIELHEEDSSSGEEDEGSHHNTQAAIARAFAPAARAQTKSKKLDMATLLSGVGDANLKMSLDKMRKAGKVERRVPKAVEERAERITSNARAKETVSEWQGVVKANREAKSVSFPLNRPNKKMKFNTRLKQSSVHTELEAEIEHALMLSGLNDKKVKAREEQEMAEGRGMTPEEVKEKQQKLAKMRALLFYEEQKSKRIKKIKSKEFRRLRKKGLQKAQDEERANMREDDPEQARKLDELDALKRAQGRMSLRHKNTSKYMRNLTQQHRQDANQILAPSLDQHEALKEKMRSLKEYESDEDLDDSDVDMATRAQEILQEPATEEAKKGLFSMKFMQTARLKEVKNVKDKAKSLYAELQGEVEKGDDEPDLFAVSKGRREYAGPKGRLTVKRARREEEEEKENKGEEKGKEVVEVKSNKSTNTKNTTNVANPWLEEDIPLNRQQRKTQKSKLKQKKVSIMEDSNGISLALEGLEAEPVEEKDAEQKALMKRAFVDAGVEEDRFEAEVEQDLNGPLTSKEEAPKLGWGSWTGFGVKAKKKKVEEEVVKKKTPSNTKLMVSTRTNKGAIKYTAEKIPYPFQTREQYERSLAKPIGKEWNTATTFKESIKPETIIQGGIIDPLSMRDKTLFQEKVKQQVQRRQSSKQKKTHKHRAQRSSKKL